MPSVLNKNVDMCKFCFECNNYVNFSYKYVVLIGEKEINQPLWSWGGWGINQYFCILFTIPFIDQEWGQDEWILNDYSSICVVHDLYCMEVHNSINECTVY